MLPGLARSIQDSAENERFTSINSSPHGVSLLDQDLKSI